MRIWETMIRNTNPHSFRCGEWADIIDTRMVAKYEEDICPCFEVRYEDGVIDWIAVEATQHYEIKKIKQATPKKVFTVDEIVRKLGEE